MLHARMTEPSDAPLADPVRYDEEEKYLVHGEYEIRQILQSLIARRALVSGCAMPRNHTFPTSIIEVLEDEDGVLIDGSASETLNRSIEEASHVTCVSRLDRIHVQFKLHDLQRVQKEGQVAFLAPLPDSILRLQRREFYRLQVPVTQPMECAVAERHPDGETTYRNYRVLDISGGGIALAVQAEEPTLRPYKEFPGSLLHLPDSGPLCIRLMVKSLHRQLNQNGSESWRAGCQFTDLPRGGDALIQRYIFRLERQRSARERGAA
jgi:c-di-GMP-binding flagellar brake protein YcgR